MKIENLIRENIRLLKPYSSARDEFSGEAKVFLDANENPYNQPYNRYPDPLQRALKTKIGRLKNVPVDSIFLGNGSDEPIDLLIRVFCEPRIHNIAQCEPTYGMYQVAAAINDVAVTKVPLSENYQLNADMLLGAAGNETRIIFLCSPNNPSGNLLDAGEIEKILKNFEGIVVLDEAYIDFTPQHSFLPRLDEFRNLVILQTFSKAWGMAGIRLGMAFACREIIDALNKIKYPYNLNILTQQKAIELIEHQNEMEKWTDIIISEREKLEKQLGALNFVEKIWPSDANFLLVKMTNARQVYRSLAAAGIVVRDRSRVQLCEESLRITIGTPEENAALMSELKKMKKSRN